MTETREAKVRERFEKWWNSDDCPTGATMPDKLLMRIAFAAGREDGIEESAEVSDSTFDVCQVCGANDLHYAAGTAIRSLSSKKVEGKNG